MAKKKTKKRTKPKTELSRHAVEQQLVDTIDMLKGKVRRLEGLIAELEAENDQLRYDSRYDKWG